MFEIVFHFINATCLKASSLWGLWIDFQISLSYLPGLISILWLLGYVVLGCKYCMTLSVHFACTKFVSSSVHNRRGQSSSQLAQVASEFGFLIEHRIPMESNEVHLIVSTHMVHLGFTFLMGCFSCERLNSARLIDWLSCQRLLISINSLNCPRPLLYNFTKNVGNWLPHGFACLAKTHLKPFI